MKKTQRTMLGTMATITIYLIWADSVTSVVGCSVGMFPAFVPEDVPVSVGVTVVPNCEVTVVQKLSPGTGGTLKKKKKKRNKTKQNE